MPSSLRFHPRGPLAVATVVAGLALVACGDDGESAGSDGPEVVATTSVAADIVGRVGGEDIEISALVPDGASPHSYSPSAQERQRLTEAELLVYFSPALEGALPIDAADASFALAGESEDPHVWLDPTEIEAALPALAEALGEVSPEHAEAYSRRADEFAAELAGLDAELSRTLDVVPPESRKLVTSHDSMGHFADRYGFAFVGAPFGLAPEAEASAETVAGLISRIEAEEVPAVFAQAGDDPEVLRRIADETGVEIVDDLRIESLGESGSYLEMMRFTTARIAEALAPGGG